MPASPASNHDPDVEPPSGPGSTSAPWFVARPRDGAHAAARGRTTKVRPNRAMVRRRLLSVVRRRAQPPGGAACARQSCVEPRSRRRTTVRPWFDVGSVVRRAAAQRKCVRTARCRGVACFPLRAGTRNCLEARRAPARPASNHVPDVEPPSGPGSTSVPWFVARRVGRPHNGSASEPRDAAASPAFRCAQARATAWRRGVRPPGPRRTTFPTSNHRLALVRRRSRGSPRGARRRAHRGGSHSAQPRNGSASEPRDAAASPAFRCAQAHATAWTRGVRPPGPHRTTFPTSNHRPALVRRRFRGSPRGASGGRTTEVRPNRAMARRRVLSVVRRHAQPPEGVGRGAAQPPPRAAQPRPAHDDARRPRRDGGRQARSRRRVRKRGERGRRDASARGARPRSGHPRHRSPGCSRVRTAGTSR